MGTSPGHSMRRQAANTCATQVGNFRNYQQGAFRVTVNTVHLKDTRHLKVSHYQNCVMLAYKWIIQSLRLCWVTAYCNLLLLNVRCWLRAASLLSDQLHETNKHKSLDSSEHIQDGRPMCNILYAGGGFSNFLAGVTLNEIQQFQCTPIILFCI
jgi:hypothetical protein